VGERKEREIKIKNKKKKVCCWVAWVGERKEREEKKNKKISNGNVSCLKRYLWSIKIKNKKFQW
jgi:hypothetical protein